MTSHPTLVHGIAGLLASHLRASHQRVSQFAQANNLCKSTVHNFLNGTTGNPTIRTCVNILNGCKRLEDLIEVRLLRQYSAAASNVIRLHSRRRAKRRVA